MNLHTKKPGKEIEIAWLKGVTAFLNTDGGTLLIGMTQRAVAGELNLNSGAAAGGQILLSYAPRGVVFYVVDATRIMA